MDNISLIISIDSRNDSNRQLYNYNPKEMNLNKSFPNYIPIRI